MLLTSLSGGGLQISSIRKEAWSLITSYSMWVRERDDIFGGQMYPKNLKKHDNLADIKMYKLDAYIVSYNDSSLNWRWAVLAIPFYLDHNTLTYNFK